MDLVLRRLTWHWTNGFGFDFRSDARESSILPLLSIHIALVCFLSSSWHLGLLFGQLWSAAHWAAVIWCFFGRLCAATSASVALCGWQAATRQVAQDQALALGGGLKQTFRRPGWPFIPRFCLYTLAKLQHCDNETFCIRRKIGTFWVFQFPSRRKLYKSTP